MARRLAAAAFLSVVVGNVTPTAASATSSRGEPVESESVPPGEIDPSQLAALPWDDQQAILSGEATVVKVTVREVPKRGDVTTQSAVGGNCGYSYFWIRNLNPGTIDLRWGFYNLCFLANAFSWNYTVVGPSYTRFDSGSGGLWFRAELSKSYSGSRGGLGLYSGCATIIAYGARTASGTACDSFRFYQ